MELVCPEEFLGWPFWLYDKAHRSELESANIDMYSAAHHAYAMACSKKAADQNLTNPMTGEPIRVKEPPQSGAKFDAYQQLLKLGQRGMFLAMGVQNELVDGERSPECAILVNQSFDPNSMKAAYWCATMHGHLDCPSGSLVVGLGEDPTGEFEEFYKLEPGKYNVTVHDVDFVEMEIKKTGSKYSGPDRVIEFNVIPDGQNPKSNDPFIFF